LALAALALVIFGAYDSYPFFDIQNRRKMIAGELKVAFERPKAWVSMPTSIHICITSSLGITLAET